MTWCWLVLSIIREEKRHKHKFPADIPDPYARMPRRQKVPANHRGSRKTHFLLVWTSMIVGRRRRPWPEVLSKNFVQKKSALNYWPTTGLVICRVWLCLLHGASGPRQMPHWEVHGWLTTAASTTRDGWTSGPLSQGNELISSCKQVSQVCSKKDYLKSAQIKLCTGRSKMVIHVVPLDLLTCKQHLSMGCPSELCMLCFLCGLSVGRCLHTGFLQHIFSPDARASLRREVVQ